MKPRIFKVSENLNHLDRKLCRRSTGLLTSGAKFDSWTVHHLLGYNVMNYRKLYNQIIEKRQKDPITEGYYETHHIVPLSLGGSNNPDNLVKLSAREHFICHYLLAKMFEKETFEWHKMNHAFMMMKTTSTNQKRYFNSRLYEALKENFSLTQSFSQQGKKNSQSGTCWICHVELKENKKIKKTELKKWEENGWIKGRDAWIRIKKELQKAEEKKRKKEEFDKKRREELLPILYDYLENGFEFVKNKYKIKSKVSAFVIMLKRYFPDNYKRFK